MTGIVSSTGARVHGELTATIPMRGSSRSWASFFIDGHPVGWADVDHRVGRHFISSNKCPSLLNNQAHGFCLDGDLEAAVLQVIDKERRDFAAMKKGATP